MSPNSPSPYRQPLSSSSSRQSLRKEVLSRPETASRPSDRQSRGTPEGRPSIDETPTQEIVTSSSHNGAVDSTEEPEVQEQHPSNPTFQPFFALVEDAHTSDYYHPNVHYIFSDDDTDIVTEAALRSLTAQQDALSESKKDQIAQTHASNPHEKDPSDPEADPETTTLLPPPVPGVRENYLILDMEPVPPTSDTAQNQTDQAKGAKSMSSSPANPSIPSQEGKPGSSKHPQFRVSSAQSFSSSWQVLDTEVMSAPTFENNTPESPGQGLMLKIRGTGGMPVEVSGKEKGAHRLEEMMEQFAKRMGELQTIIDAAEAETQPDEQQELEHDPSEDAGQTILEEDAALRFD
ncbi:hypothetical protein PENANT_c018G01053 [Penicillium antarcticum]|uniref:Uncharacterized protein n=1 Tax=Penicillium antarcticum TaxID=416450 RepID=A0A1V6Q1T0_9EURO|nr:uncharacterized protein N7508_003897 [Penicillium antarcticum]KAJ5313067.1 hypothetical protein N7508_003897 [Penicillium antarcticum]OQD83007.1 hypothetical protein PENANT_c018G01053 [Penicillium antarcticum]